MKQNTILNKTEKISNYFLEMGIFDFENAGKYIKKLPYKRNLNKENIFCVLEEEGGTCSTKHALIKRLADENNYDGVKLMLGIFKMNAENTPKIAPVLQKYHLKEMPEAHNYLKFRNEIQDFTTKNSEPKDFVNDLVQEIEIQANQITQFKIGYHKNFLENYLVNNPQIKYSPSEFWHIREECIAALQH